MIGRVLTLVLALAAPAVAVADETPTAERLFAQATAAYTEGVHLLASDPRGAASSLKLSASLFQRLVDGGDGVAPAVAAATGPMYFNLGSVYLLAGDTGRAVLNLRRAELLMPPRAEVRENLSAARQKVGTPADDDVQGGAVGSALAYLEAVPAAVRFDILLGGLSAAWTLALWRLLAHAHRPPRALVGAAALVALVGGASLAPREVRLRAHAADGVVVAPEVTGRAGPDDLTYEASPGAPIKGGAEVKVVEVRGAWTLVELRDGVRSWIPGGAVERILPSPESP